MEFLLPTHLSFVDSYENDLIKKLASGVYINSIGCGSIYR